MTSLTVMQKSGTIFFVVLVIFLLAVLSAFYLFSVKKLSLWQNKPVAKKISNLSPIVTNLKISTFSQVDGVNLEVYSKENLDSFLEKIGSRDGEILNIKNGNLVKIKELKIILTNSVDSPIYQSLDKDGNLWDAVGLSYDDDEMVLSLFRKDWRGGHVNLLINNAMLRVGAKTKKAFDQQLSDEEKQWVNEKLFLVQKND